MSEHHHTADAIGRPSAPATRTEDARARRSPAAGAALALVLLAATVLTITPAAVRVAAPAAAAVAPSGVDWGKLTPDPGDTLIGPAPATAPMQVTLGFRRDDAGLAAFATAVSDPSSPQYRQFGSVADLAARFGISDQAWADVDADLRARGLHFTLDATRAFALGDIDVGQASSLFGVTLNAWKEPVPPGNPPWPDAIYPASSPTLPAALAPHVDLVRGLSQWGELGGTTWEPGAPAPGAATDAAYPFHPGPGGDPIRTGTPQGCPTALDYAFAGAPAGFTPNQLRTAYGLDPLTAAGYDGAGARAAVVLDTPALPSDLAAYQACFGQRAVPFAQSNPARVGGAAGNDEGAIDVQMLAAMAPGLDRLDLVVPPTTIDPRFDLTYFLWMFAGPLDPSTTGGMLPDVISASTGVCEQAWQLPENRALVPVFEFILSMGAAAGTNWFVASGDFGTSNCKLLPFVPDPLAPSVVYPSSSPWATSVGGTNLTLAADNTITSFGAWNDEAMGFPTSIASAGGGGTSVLFGRPAWQRGPGVPAGTMRTVPDVSHMAAALPGTFLLLDGTPYSEPGNGTSAATPLTAGMTAVMIGALRAHGQGQLGALNPLVYSLASRSAGGMRDVVLGTIDLYDKGCCSATPGYDLATGWGSFDLATLTSALAPLTVTLPAPPPTRSGGAVTLTATAVAPAGEVVRYDWDLTGDGTVDQSTSAPSVTWVPGTLPVTVTVTAVSDLGRSGSATAVVSPVAVAVVVDPRFAG